jgi:hypothetical protein
MKDEWFSDHLDLIKWAIVHRLAASHGLQHVAHIAFFSPSKTPSIHIDVDDHPVNDVVWRYFRDWKRMEQQSLGDLRVRIFDQTWHGTARSDYVKSASCWLKQQKDARLVLLDPDTGLAPTSGGDHRHLRPSEVNDIWLALKTGDILAIYQHAPRGKNQWMQTQLSERYQDLGDLLGNGHHFQIAHRKEDHPKAAIFWLLKSSAVTP